MAINIRSLNHSLLAGLIERASAYRIDGRGEIPHEDQRDGSRPKARSAFEARSWRCLS